MILSISALPCSATFDKASAFVWLVDNVLCLFADIFSRIYRPVPGIPALAYTPFLPTLTLAPVTPNDVLTPLLLKLSLTPGHNFTDFLKRNPMISPLFRIVINYLGGLQRLQGVYPSALASFKVISIFERDKLPQPSLWYLDPVRVT